MAGLMGGRTAEEIIFTESSGASNDFEQATQIARAMVTQYGMSEKSRDCCAESATSQQAPLWPNTILFTSLTATIDEEVRRLTMKRMPLLRRSFLNTVSNIRSLPKLC